MDIVYGKKSDPDNQFNEEVILEEATEQAVIEKNNE